MGIHFFDPHNKSPRYVWKPAPDFISHLEKRRYYEKEVERWRDGHLGMTGFQYFYLSQWMVFDISTKKAIHPLWFEDDEDLIFTPIEHAFKKRYDLVACKKRRAHWSSVEAALGVWQSLIEMGSSTGYTSADLDRVAGFFKKNIEYGLKRLREALPADIFNFDYKVISGKTTNQARIWDGKGEEVSYIDGFETVRDPFAFEGGTYGLILLDEIALHGKITEVWGSADASRLDGQYRSGLVFAGGTAGNITVEARKLFKQKVEDASDPASRIITTFILGMHANTFIQGVNGEKIPTTINGYTDHKRVTEWIEKERERLWKKGGDMKDYWHHYYAYPLSNDEIFMATDESKLPEDIKVLFAKQSRAINQRIKDSKSNKEDFIKVGVISLRGERAEFNEKANGCWKILEYPQSGHKYIMGTDPIPAESAAKDGSMYKSVIKDETTHQVVAIYEKRIDDAKTLLSDTIAGQIFYNNAMNMMEMDKGAAFLSLYGEWNKLNLMADSPYSLGVKFTKLSKGKGFKALAFGDLGDDFVLSYFREHYDKIWFLDIIEEGLKWGTGVNMDLKDAMRACEIFHKNNQAKENKNKQNKNQIISVPCVDSSGKLIMIELRIGSDLQ